MPRRPHNARVVGPILGIKGGFSPRGENPDIPTGTRDYRADFAPARGRRWCLDGAADAPALCARLRSAMSDRRHGLSMRPHYARVSMCARGVLARFSDLLCAYARALCVRAEGLVRSPAEGLVRARRDGRSATAYQRTGARAAASRRAELRAEIVAHRGFWGVC